MFDPGSRNAIARIAKRLGVEPAALLAVAEIESAGNPFANVHGKPMPLIRWECHYFFRLLPPDLRQRGVAAHLAHPVAGTIPNPASQQSRYDMLARGKAIHEVAALSSCSWGMGQVMGAHWKSLGFRSVQEFVRTACSGVAGQTELMARFIQTNGLTTDLKRKNWAGFARAYNGSGYKANAYDTKMGRAYIRYLGGKMPPPGVMAPIITDFAQAMDNFTPTPEVEEFSLQPGSSGPAVKELQQALRKAGYFVYTDGHYGPATKKAVAEFQKKAGLPSNGVVDGATRAKFQSQQASAVAPWWHQQQSDSAAGGPPKPKKTAWWEGGGHETLPKPAGKKLWWEA
jgi:hypothetical protein